MKTTVGIVVLALVTAACGAATEPAAEGPAALTDNDAGTVAATAPTTTTMDATDLATQAGNGDLDVMKDEDALTPELEQGAVDEIHDDLAVRDKSGVSASSQLPVTPGGPVEQAMVDLAHRLDRPMTDIRVVASDEVTWRDGSLGCPQPGMYYTQALVPGLRIKLAVDSTIYEYHTGRDLVPFFCADPQEPLPPADA